MDFNALVRQNSALQARRAGHWCWENCLLWNKDPSTHGSNPVFVKTTEERWILGHMQDCWSWRWKLKERYKHKANVRQRRKAAAKHWTMKTVGADFARILTLLYYDILHLCMYLCGFLRAQISNELLEEIILVHSDTQWAACRHDNISIWISLFIKATVHNLSKLSVSLRSYILCVLSLAQQSNLQYKQAGEKK